jgi:excisionase family DNA binding protein
MTDRLEAAIAELVDAIRAEVAGQAVAAPERLLSIDEAATMLGIGRSTVYAELAAGRLRTTKVGRRRLVPAGAIADYVAAAR